MRPLRRTILQFSQIRLTLERTFMTGPIVKKSATQKPRNAGCSWSLRCLICPRPGRLIAINRPDRPQNLPTPQAVRDLACGGIGRLYAKGGFVHKQTRHQIWAKSEGPDPF